MARMLLAAMDSEPVGEVVLGDYDDCGDYPDAKVVCIAAQGQADWNNFRNGTKLYTAPPAPLAVPDDVLKGLLPDAEKAEFWFEHNGKILFEGVKFNNAVFDACRAAMLKAGPVTATTVPDGWKLVPVEPTKEMIDAGWSYYMTTKSPSSLGVYGAMLAAAPEQE